MSLKLNEKGAQKIIDAVELELHVDEHGQDYMTVKLNEKEIELEQDDFTDSVILTVEEAGILVRCAANEFCRLILEHAPIDSARQVEALMYDLVKRIKKSGERS